VREAIKRQAYKSLFDCVLKISKEGIIAFNNNANAYISKKFSVGDNISENIKNFSKTIEWVFVNLEKQSLCRIENASVIVDLGVLKSSKVKVFGMNFGILRERIEVQMGHKIVNISLLEKQGDYNVLQILSMSKNDIQIIVDIISGMGIHVTDITSDFKTIAQSAFNVFQKETFSLLKISSETSEIARVSNGKIGYYTPLQGYSLNEILERVSKEVNLPVLTCEKLIKFYNTTSKVDRLKVYYEREVEDGDIQDVIMNQGLITILLFQTRKIVEELYFFSKQKLASCAICFYYAQEEAAKFHVIKGSAFQFDVFEFKVSDIKTNSVSEDVIPISGIFARQIKKFFYLTS
jgi:hypothetical protein